MIRDLGLAEIAVTGIGDSKLGSLRGHAVPIPQLGSYMCHAVDAGGRLRKQCCRPEGGAGSVNANVNIQVDLPLRCGER